MTATFGARLDASRKFLPLASTVALFIAAYLFGMSRYEGMRDGQAFFNLFYTTPFLLICVVGETFVVISGGIDLSVSGILALTTVAAALLINQGWWPWYVFPVMLAMGMTFGLVMGYFITYLKVQPFIATLAGMWFARGMCYVLSDAEVRIHDGTYKTLNQTKILIPGLSDPANKTGDYISYLVVIALTVLVVGMFIMHFTKFGRTVYAIGGNGGANEQSARLMGLPVNRTKLLVYVISGFCSSLAGITYSIYVGSGHGTHASGFELTVIAAVVIGGIALTGGEGYLIGALFGALITALIQSLIQYDGTLLSWWTYIIIGLLMLMFIGVQSIVAAWNRAAIGRSRAGGLTIRKKQVVWYKRRIVRQAGALVLVVVLLFVGANVLSGILKTEPVKQCERAPLRTQDQFKALTDGGAIVVYNRNGGSKCVDELYAIYADGKITKDLGGDVKTEQVTPEKVTSLLELITKWPDEQHGFFSDYYYTAIHTPCAACYTYSLTITYNGKTKNVTGVDGGTDMYDKFWDITSDLAGLLYPGQQY
jgi:galactofuranose transport system permease protein